MGPTGRWIRSSPRHRLVTFTRDEWVFRRLPDPYSGTLHSIIPLSVLEAVRANDQSDPSASEMGGDGESSAEAIKLGRTPTIAVQIDRFRVMARRGLAADPAEVAALCTLVARRADAALVFAEAGRLIGQRAAAVAPMALRLLHRGLPGPLRHRVGRRLIRRQAEVVLGLAATAPGNATQPADVCPTRNVLSGRACGLYGAALAELSRQFVPFDGACYLARCQARGDSRCEWSTRTEAPR